MTLASRSFGDGVQSIVATAKAKGDGSWKPALLDLLGQGGKEDGAAQGKKKASDVDVLLQHSRQCASQTSTFTAICLEHELAPNLVHCLRLLRVLELQHAQENPNAEEPQSAAATLKVRQLLCTLCTEPATGEQLRPHLFGLLALSGASYPSTGAHVAQAAATVIRSLGDHCLSPQLLWFLRDRKMVLHMTDDVKELMNPTPVPHGLTGAAAEAAGLVEIAVSTVVHLIHAAFMTCGSIDLMQDFVAADGYAVVRQAVLSATRPGSCEWITALACCPETVLVEDSAGLHKLVCNETVMDFLQDLLTRSNPILRRERIRHGEDDWEKNMELHRRPTDLHQMATAAITAGENGMEQNLALDVKFDLPTELLAITLQLFADHPNNYEILESRLNILTYSLLAFPCFEKQDTKLMVLKSLELVLTAVGTSHCETPVTACMEVFFALLNHLLEHPDTPNIAADLEMLTGTLEKLLEFDQRVAPLFCNADIWRARLSVLLDGYTGASAPLPPASTVHDSAMATVCRILQLLVSHQPFLQGDGEGVTKNTILKIAMRHMGVTAAVEASGVFEAYMISSCSAETLDEDMVFVSQMINDVVDLLRENKSNPGLLKRLAILVSMLRSVLEEKRASRKSFRTADGFNTLLKLVLGMREISSHFGVEELSDVTVELLQAIVSLLDAAIGMKARNSLTANEISPLSIQAHVSVDCISSQLSLESASSLNRNFLRQSKFYLNLSAAIAGTGVFETDRAGQVVDLILGHIDPELTDAKKATSVQSVRNPDSIRLALGAAVFMPNARTGNPLATQLVDQMLRLCEPDRLASTLPQLANCGICYSLTDPKEFGPILFEENHSLQSRFSLFLCRTASHSMSYMEFVSILRNVAGPVIAGDEKSVRLPVISSAVKKQCTVLLSSLEDASEEAKLKEHEFSKRLEAVCGIARNADSASRIRVGGDSINTISVLMHEVRLDERLKAAAEEGRLRYLEIESIDASALAPNENDTEPSAAMPEKIWAPLAASGFTYSLWMRHSVPFGNTSGGNLHILDICNQSTSGPNSGTQDCSFLAVWYDLQNHRFNVMSSASYRGEPTCFPASPLTPDSWHHVMLTYTPAKRSMIARKSVFSIYVDGRALEAEVRVESVTLPPNSRVVLGAPNPTLSMSGVVRGVLPVWELGPTLMLSTVLLDLDATAIYSYGPQFPGLLWGDRPQRLSLAAVATAMFSMLPDTGEHGHIGSFLRRRDTMKLEKAGASGLLRRDDLAVVNLLCSIPPECVVFGFQASTVNNRMRNEAVKKESRLGSKRLVNLARINYAGDLISTDGVVYGKETLISPSSFQDCLRWVGGPHLLMPLVNAAPSARVLAQSLQLIRLGCECHRPNLEMLQSGGGYLILGVLLQGKGVVDERCLDQCLGFAIHGFDPCVNASGTYDIDPHTIPLEQYKDWVFADLDAMKYLLLNHQVWDLRKYGPKVPQRLLQYLNLLVSHRSRHKVFNAKRLHDAGIVRWALHLAIEAAELYTVATSYRKRMDDDSQRSAFGAWSNECPHVSEVSVGGDPGNSFLLECRNLLRRVLTFILTPGDLEELVEGIVFTLSIGGDSMPGPSRGSKDLLFQQDEYLLPGPTLRLHLVRLLEELIVDGVNEIVATGMPESTQDVAMPHVGGVASFGQPYFTTACTRGMTPDGTMHPKHVQAQNFLAAFASFLKPTWFAAVLEGCREEASASALLRLMILMIQGCTKFEEAFLNEGCFAPFALSLPKFSTCPGIAIPMLSHLLNVPILHLHSLPTLDAEQLNEVFDAESLEADPSDPGRDDPTSSIFYLIVELIGRNVKYVSMQDENNDESAKASATNEAIVQLLLHRHAVSPCFREYCQRMAFLEPLAQVLCLVYKDDGVSKRGKRPTLLSDIPRDLSPTERFIGSYDDPNSTGMGVVRLVRLIVADAMKTCPCAAGIVYTLFRAFPVHASPQQVGAFHLVLLEQCCAVIDGILQGREVDAAVIANCIGVCSVFVDHQIGAFFTSEAAMKTVKSTVSILNALLKFDTPAIYSMSNSEHSMLTRDAAYIANLACVTALRISLPMDASDPGDTDLQSMILETMNENIASLLLLAARDRKSNWKVPTGKVTKPSQNSKAMDVWQSASVTRCVKDRPLFFPDSFVTPKPDVVTVAPLLISLYRLLLGSQDNVRSLAVSVFVALLEHRCSLLSELLVTEVKRNGKTETIDVVSRGGFKALVTAQEAATYGDNSPPANVKKTHASFFDWFDRNKDDVRLVFNALEKTARELFPGLQETAVSQEETIENEQKLMILRLSTDKAERSLVGGLERSELLRTFTENTAEMHSRWRRKGFDDLAFGATKWKFLLRQLKGSTSIWEGGPRFSGQTDPFFALSDHLALLESGDNGNDERQNTELVQRWKLDLTEGAERQRRRLLPNYEFHGLYNLEEDHDTGRGSKVQDKEQNGATDESLGADFLLQGGQMEATAALLKDLNIKRAHRDEQLEDDFEENDIDNATAETDVSSETDGATHVESAPEESFLDSDDDGEDVAAERDSSGCELIKGLMQPADWPEQWYNVRRCTGLEVTKALLLWCGHCIYVIDGFEESAEKQISRVEKERSSFHINLRPKNSKPNQDDDGNQSSRTSNTTIATKKGRNVGQEDSSSEVIYEHRSQRILMTDLYAVYRRRYQLQQTGLEFYDTQKSSVLIAFENQTKREEVLTKVMQSHIPNSIFSASIGSFISYTKFMRNRQVRITSQWQNGKMSNFDFLMELNSLAGRSFNDLTAYPVFPWVIADYESEVLDLNDPKTFRDLSKPMGAIGEQRANQFHERYEALVSTYFGEDDPPPFHYGTHYSCAAYVLYYLMRLEPFSRLALALQGGRFDVADRLFHDVGRSWRSASSENLQDVRELIPEFYFLPDFLMNTNDFDFGETQRGKVVHDVTLPKWAKGDPKRFVRINRQALESPHVSKHLHLWIDLVFGYKQRGEEAVKSLNTFVHVTYEGEVDIDAMEDPVQRQSTIAQIQNFGQTPSRLERYPFPQRNTPSIVKDKAIDFGAIGPLTCLTPPLCVVGAPQRVRLYHIQTDSCKLGLAGQSDQAVGEICYVKGQVIAVGRLCALNIPSKKYFRFGGLNNGVTVHTAVVTSKFREVDKLMSIHDDMHRAPIVSAKASLDGDWLVTGSVDSTLRVWYYDSVQLRLRATLCGHDGAHVSCLDVSTECGVIVSGCEQGGVLMWDLRTLTFVRMLRHRDGKPVLSVSINHKNGNVATLVGQDINVFDINGRLLACREFSLANYPTCAISTDCPEWMEEGVAVLSGHSNGEVRLWSIDFDRSDLVLRHAVEASPHVHPISALRVTGVERQDTLLIGDRSGVISVFKSSPLDSFSTPELDTVVREISAKKLGLFSKNSFH